MFSFYLSIRCLSMRLQLRFAGLCPPCWPGGMNCSLWRDKWCGTLVTNTVRAILGKILDRFPYLQCFMFHISDQLSPFQINCLTETMDLSSECDSQRITRRFSCEGWVMLTEYLLSLDQGLVAFLGDGLPRPLDHICIQPSINTLLMMSIKSHYTIP